MNTDQNGERFSDIDRILADVFAEDAPPSEPPLLIPALLARTALTRQRPAWRIPSRWLPPNVAWRPRTHGRLNTMATPIRIAATAAAIGVLAVVGGIVPRNTGPGGPNLVASPSPSPITLPDGALEAGTTYFIGSRRLNPVRLILTVPATGWSASTSALSVGKDPFGMIRMSPTLVWNVHTDPCNWRETALDPPVGPTVDDFATALAAQPLQNVSAVTDVTLDGYPGKRLEMAMPDDVDLFTCDKTSDGQVVFGRWNFPDDPYAPYAGPWAFGNGQRDTVYIIDVAGTRLVIDTSSLPGASEADLAELDQLLESVRFEPLASPAPSPSPST